MVPFPNPKATIKLRNAMACMIVHSKFAVSEMFTQKIENTPST